MTKAAKYILFGQITMWMAVAICTIIMPQFLFRRNQGGISNFGVHASTVIPFSVGIIGSGIATLAAAANIRQWKLRASVALIGILYLLIALTTYTYKINTTFNLVHQYVTIALFIAELPLAIWFGTRLAKSIASTIALTLFGLGFLAATLTHFGLLHVLFVAETLSGMSFGYLLYLAVRRNTV